MRLSHLLTGRDTPKAEAHGAPRAPELRRLAAEFLGTFSLTFVAAGMPVIGSATGHALGTAANVVAPALLIIAMVYTVGPLSGAHFNPAVTLTFALRKDFPWARVGGYWTMQMAGAAAAAELLKVMFGLHARLGATVPLHGVVSALAMEVILTLFLIIVILGTATDHRLVGHNAALAVGGMIAADGMLGAAVSGASMNPARSFGPAIVGGSMRHYWIYVAGPFGGALLAVAIAYLLWGKAGKYERQAADG